MPPIPSHLPEEALSLISAIERRHNHISQVEIPALRNCTGPLAVQQSFAEEVRQDTGLLTRQVEELDLMVDDLRGEKNRQQLKEVVTGFRQRLDNLKVETRAALLESKKAIDQRARSNRQELFASSSILSEKEKSSSNEKSTEDAVMKANADVTYALRRTIALMQTELERSVLSTQLLQDSTSALLSTSQQHDTLSTVMHTSKQLVTALEKTDWLDRVLILSGLVFFLLVVALILKQRIVDRGLRIAFWWTRFIPSFSDDAELLRNMEKGAVEVVEAATQSLSSVVVSAASSIIPTASIALSSLGVTSSLSPSPTPTPDSADPEAILSEILESISLSASSEEPPLLTHPVSVSEAPILVEQEAESSTLSASEDITPPSPEAPDPADHVEL